jgi:hypothetical protein
MLAGSKPACQEVGAIAPRVQQDRQREDGAQTVPVPVKTRTAGAKALQWQPQPGPGHRTRRIERLRQLLGWLC